MTGTIRKVTVNYNLRIPRFDAPNWGKEMQRNFEILDAVLFANSQFGDIRGPWQNSTLYLINDRVVDDEGSTWECVSEHTSAASGTFADERTNDPLLWNAITEFVSNRGIWAGGQNYKRNDFIEDNGRFGVVKTSYTSGTSYDEDVTNEYIITLIDLTGYMLAIDASVIAAGNSADDAAGFASQAEDFKDAASGFATDAYNSAVDAGEARDVVTGLYTNLAGGTTNQILMKSDNTDFSFTWVDLTGGGDMIKAVYDPNNVGSDAFNRANHTGTQAISTITDLQDTLNAIIPVGIVLSFARSTPPSGFLACNGAAVSRTTYSGLFAIIGTTFGAGDGSTTFNIPDLRGEFVRGWDDGRGVDAARAFGSAQADAFRTHTHTVDPPSTATSSDTHNHSVDPPSTSTSSDTHSHTVSAVGGGTQWAHQSDGAWRHDDGASTKTTNSNTHGHTVNIAAFNSASDTHSHTVDIAVFNSGSTGGTETRPRNVALLMCIKY